MTSSGTRGISFPNASKIICYIPTFSLESNFMEFLQGIYRGRGSGKGNALEREIELIVPQVLVAPPDNSPIWREKQRVNLLATLMLLRMSILTRIFGAADLFGKPVACIPTAGTLVEGAARTTLDEVHEALQELQRNLRYNPKDNNLRFIVEELPKVFDNERAILYHNTGQAKTLASGDYRQRLSKQFLHDAKQGLDVIAQGDYLPENCYEEFWAGVVDDGFKQNTQALLKTCFGAYVCKPNYTLPILSTYGDKALPWLLVRGPEIEQRLAAQYQTRYLISSTALALLNVLLLAGQNQD